MYYDNQEDSKEDDSEDCILIVENITKPISNNDLREIFNPFGAKRCRTAYRKDKFLGFAGINFKTEDEARNAMEANQYREVKGNRIECRLATERDLTYFQKPKKKAKKNKSFDGPSVADLLSSSAFLSNSNTFNPVPSIQPQNHFASNIKMNINPNLNSNINVSPSPSSSSSSSTIYSPFPILEVNDVKFDFDSIKDILQYEFCFIDFVTLISEPYYPCEVAVVVFSLNAGEIRTFHTLIDCGQIDSRYLIDAKFFIESKHGIPYANSEIAQMERNFEHLLDKIYQTVYPNTPPNQNTYPTIPLWSKGPSKCNRCIQWLLQKVKRTNNIFGTVKEIEELLLNLHRKANSKLPTSALSNYFKPEVLNPLRTSKCGFHSQMENKNCALANARALAEVFLRTAIELKLAKPPVRRR